MNKLIKTCSSGHGHNERCNDCESELKDQLYCSACEKIQNYNNSLNYYSIFGVKPSYKVDKKEINDAFERLIVSLHPDMYMTSSKEDQALSLSHTALLYEAKDTLFNPFKRGRYLLTFLSGGQSNPIPQPPGLFIMDMFEIQEELDEVEEGRGDLGSIANEITNQIQKIDQQLLVEFDELIKINSEQKIEQGKAKQILENLSKLKFVENLAERLNSLKKLKPVSIVK